MDKHAATVMHKPSSRIQKMIHRHVNATTLFSVVNNIVCVILCSFLLVLFIISTSYFVKIGCKVISPYTNVVKVFGL